MQKNRQRSAQQKEENANGSVNKTVVRKGRGRWRTCAGWKAFINGSAVWRQRYTSRVKSSVSTHMYSWDVIPEYIAAARGNRGPFVSLITCIAETKTCSSPASALPISSGAQYSASSRACSTWGRVPVTRGGGCLQWPGASLLQHMFELRNWRGQCDEHDSVISRAQWVAHPAALVRAQVGVA